MSRWASFPYWLPIGLHLLVHGCPRGSCQERIFTVYGRVNSAMDLIAADITGKSDPYASGEHISQLPLPSILIGKSQV